MVKDKISKTARIEAGNNEKFCFSGWFGGSVVRWFGRACVAKGRFL